MTTTTTAAPPAAAAAAAAAGPLHSDHINYLIFRYLQEAGHEASATAFSRDWRRPAEYHNPENLPFAGVVNRHELVSVIQDGLHHDELVSKVRKEGRRFRWTTNRADTGNRPESANGSRPGTAGGAKKKGRVNEARKGAEEFPTPPPKRQRKSEEEPQPQVNGDRGTDAMDVDPASPSAADAEGEDDPDAVSPTVASPEPEIVEVPERYDSMDVGIQTDGKTGPKTSTMYWTVEKPDATILHASFSLKKGASGTLFTAGEGLCRFYEVPDGIDGDEKLQSLDDPHLPPDSVVTACSWHPSGDGVALAMDGTRDLPVGGKQTRRQAVLSHDMKSSKATRYSYPPVLEPSALVLALRYNDNGSKLLAVCTNGSRGMVVVWDTASRNGAMQEDHDPLAWALFEDQVLDAVWLERDRFALCGDNSLYQRYRLSSVERDLKNLGPTPSSVPEVGLDREKSIGINFAEPMTFDKTCPCGPEPPGHLIASTEGKRLVRRGPNESLDVQTLPGQLTALAATSTTGPETPSLFAAAFEDGSCNIYLNNENVDVGCTLQLVDDSPALALAWSPEDAYLALSGADVVQIWERSSINQHINTEQSNKTAPAPLVVWRRDRVSLTNGMRDGEHAVNGNQEDEDESVEQPSLSWSADSSSLALAVGNKVAVIRFRPPLREEVNGDGG